MFSMHEPVGEKTHIEMTSFVKTFFFTFTLYRTVVLGNGFMRMKQRLKTWIGNHVMANIKTITKTIFATLRRRRVTGPMVILTSRQVELDL